MVASASALGTAHAQTTIGQTPATTMNNVGCFQNLQFVQALTAGPPGYDVPAGSWLLTSWTHRAAGANGQMLKLKVFRPVGDPATTTRYLVVAADGPRPLGPNALNTFNLGSPIPVEGGDRLGLVAKSSETTNPVYCNYSTGVPGDEYRFDNNEGDLPPGATMTTDFVQQNARLNVSATLVEAPSPPLGGPPNTTITKGPKDKTKKKTATFEFTASPALASKQAVTFACKLDSGPFEPCTSPKTYKVKKGKHTFQVQATEAGLSDPTPATDDWKRKKKKKN
jgi:hypothetical protein